MEDTKIKNLGNCEIPSPLKLSKVFGDGISNFMPNNARVRFQAEIGTGIDNPDIFFENAGPRENIFFNPEKSRAAIVTCGGLCPGLNNVIRSLVFELYHNYGVRKILGLRYGFRGLNPREAYAPMPMNPAAVDKIHRMGGTILGTSRGPQDPGMMVDFLHDQGINMLFCIGGDGTQHGSHIIAEEVLRRDLKIAVVGIPKTIDNDILYVKNSFGYFSAVEQARLALDCAHTEARSAWNGIGLVKVMGRDSGFVAVGATLVSQDVNYTLIPEVPFDLDGENGFLKSLHQRIEDRGHAVIVVAEGAGQNLLNQAQEAVDASGNRKLGDIGLYLKQCILDYFGEQQTPVSLKYIDPSYIIRSVPANSQDCLLCDCYARFAAHAALAGKTDLLIGYWNDSFMHVPLPMAIAKRRKIDPEGELWSSVISATAQPRDMRNFPA